MVHSHPQSSSSSYPSYRTQIGQLLRRGSWPERLLLGLAGLAGIGGVIVRLYHLALPSGRVFDEVYFPVFAKQILEGKLAFDVHPPLGKYLLAIGIRLFGDTSFGWRIVPAVMGIAGIGLMLWVWQRFAAYAHFDRTLTGDLPTGPFSGQTLYLRGSTVIASLILLIFIALDPMLVVYARTGLMDGILFFSIFACFGCALTAQRPWQVVVGLGILIGIAISIKWIGAGVILPIAYVLWRRKLLFPYLGSLLLAVAVYLLIMLVAHSLDHPANLWTAIVEWHKTVWGYHIALKDGHPWGSPWWSWPIMERPLLMYYQDLGSQGVEVITAIGNPLVWWSSSLAAVVSALYLGFRWIVERRPILDHPLTPLLIGMATFWLPWVPVHRVLFIYHYLPAYGFALLMLVYWLAWFWQSHPWAVLLYLGAVVLLAGAYLPISMALPISLVWLKGIIWFKAWLWESPWPHDPRFTS